MCSEVRSGMEFRVFELKALGEFLSYHIQQSPQFKNVKNINHDNTNISSNYISSAPASQVLNYWGNDQKP